MKMWIINILVGIGVLVPVFVFIMLIVRLIIKGRSQGWTLWDHAKSLCGFTTLIFLILAIMAFIFRKIQFSSENSALIGVSTLMAYGFYLLIAVVGGAFISSLAFLIVAKCLKSGNQ